MTSRLVLHDILNSSQWPRPVEEIARVLARPLPTYLATGPYPSVSATASRLLRELSDSPWLRTTREDILNSEEKPLTDVFNIVLSTVSELRELVNYKDHGYPLPTIPIWSTLIKTLGYACSSDIAILGEVPFILPRLAPSELRESPKLEGVATVLLSYVVHSVERSETHSVTSSMGAGRQSVSNHSSDNQMDDDDVSMDYMEQPGSKVSATSSIDLPFDAHVLPGRGRRFCAILPLLCVTDEENINSLLSSVLYQRRVWGIVDPVVGIVFSRSGTIGQVVLGWLDSECIDDDNLPTVNIARSISDSICNPSLGVFDLTDPGLMFFFAQFILGLNTHFHAVMRATSNSKIQTLSWRSDHIAIDNRKTDGEQWRSRVEHWTRGIMSDDSSEDGSFPDTPSPQAPPLILPVSPSTSMPRRIRRSASKHGKESQSSRISQGPKVPHVEISDVDELANVKLKPEAKSYFSSSSFGKRSARGLAGPASISTWLFDRKVLTIGLIKLGNEADNVTEINKMIDFYHSMTEFLWPPEWKSLDALPRVDNPLKRVREQLFDQYKKFRENVGSSTVGDLDPSHVAIVCDQFSVLMGAVTGAFALAAYASDRPVCEAEARHDWDAVLFRFFVADGEEISPNVLLETTLRFPRNSAADSTDPQNFLSSQLEIGDAYYRHCSYAQVAAINLDGPVSDQAVAASYQASSFKADIGKHGGINLLNFVKKRAGSEPRTGRCDAIFVTPVSLGDGPQVPNVKEYLKTFSLLLQGNVTPPVPSHLSPTTASSPALSSTALPPEDKKLLTNPLDFFTHESKFFPPPEAPKGFVPFKPNDLLLSGFVAEFKKWNDDQTKALNQCRMYLVSAVTHLSTLGIQGFAVFGLVTSGQRGGVLMAWKSKSDDKIYIIERNIRRFDLSSPIEAFQLASFLIRVREHTQRLKDLFEERRDEFIEKINNGILPLWTKLEQVKEVGPEGEVMTGNVEGVSAIVVAE